MFYSFFVVSDSADATNLNRIINDNIAKGYEFISSQYIAPEDYHYHKWYVVMREAK